MSPFRSALIFALCIFAQIPTDVVSKSISNEIAMQRLKNYGYFDDKSTRSQKDVAKALEEFQEFAGIPVTGVLDEATIEKLEAPRCGMSDKSSKYTLGYGKWEKNDLTYGFDNYSPDLPDNQIERIIRDAFDTWADVSKLSFTKEEVSANSDIRILFGSGNHGDSYPFDGPGSVLAHAYFPANTGGIRGDAHFDEDETWTDQTTQGINLFWVAVHEFGHSLGLGHSEDRDAVMYPYYTGYDSDFSLPSDDIAGIQALYGEPDVTTAEPTTAEPTTAEPTTAEPTTAEPTTAEPTTAEPTTAEPTTAEPTTAEPTTAEPTTAEPTTAEPTTAEPTTAEPTTAEPTTTEPPRENPLCSNPKIDAAVTTALGDTYVFQGEEVYKLTDDREVEIGYPKPISDEFPNGPRRNIQAALTNSDGYTYLFQGRKYTKYTSDLQFVERGYIKNEFPGIRIRGIDSAFEGGDGYLYFLKRTFIYKYDEANGNIERLNILRNFNNIPRGILAAVNIDDAVYLFKGTEYYELDLAQNAAVCGYPKNTLDDWFGCSA